MGYIESKFYRSISITLQGPSAKDNDSRSDEVWARIVGALAKVYQDDNRAPHIVEIQMSDGQSTWEDSHEYIKE